MICLLILSMLATLVASDGPISGLLLPQVDLTNPTSEDFPIPLNNQQTVHIYIDGSYTVSDLVEENVGYISLSDETGFPLEIQIRQHSISVVKCGGEKFGTENNDRLRCDDVDNSKEELNSGINGIQLNKGDTYELLVCINPSKTRVMLNQRILLDDAIGLNETKFQLVWVGGLHNMERFQLKQYPLGENPECSSTISSSEIENIK